MNALLRLDGIACIRGDRLLFEALSLTLARGDALWLRGPNGAGNNRSEAYAAAAEAACSIRHICRAVYAAAMRTYITESHIISSFEKSLPCLFGICIDKNTWFPLGGTVER